MSTLPRSVPEIRPANRLLRALPTDVFERLSPNLRTVPTTARQIFHRAGKPLEQVYFLNGGVGSVTTLLSDGRMVETATVGVEGMIGIEALFSAAPVARGETMLQVPDTDAQVLSVPAFRAELGSGGALAELMGRYTQAVVGQMMQSTACNALHDVEERCCRWLLMTHDRVLTDEFELSHEFLSMMLGVRRQSVTVVAGTLQRAGLITYKRGVVRVVDRAGLEAASCECYAILRKQFAALNL